MNQLGKPHGALGVSQHLGIISPAYFVATVGPAAEPAFVHHLLRTRLYISEYERRGKFMPPSQFDISWDQFRSIEVMLPPRSEQRKIADWLDQETSRIDSLTALKRRLRDLAWHRYVAAIDASCAELPDVVPLKRVARVDYGLGQPPPLAEAGVPIVRATNISRGRITPEKLIFAATTDIPWSRCPPLMVGELLVVRSGALTGDSAMVTSEWAGAAPGYDLRVMPKSVDPALLANQFLGQFVGDQIDLARGRAAQPHLNAEDLGDVKVRVGPAKVERDLALRLTRLREDSGGLGSALSAQIDLLVEHRQALITAAVTGELEIPGVAE
ncbi:MAG: hypothetical protein ABMA25_24515 [Ilumatobacteraceae bacterium]